MRRLGIRAVALVAVLAMTTPSLVLAQGPPAPIQNPANGHYYDAVAAVGNWDAANTAAQNASFMACQGHLATITSQAENDFIAQNFPLATGGTRFGYWLGGFQPPNSPEPAGGWQWVTGEPFVYTNWNAFEPNDFQGEDRIHFLGGPGWNDLSGSNSAILGYVVEFDCLFVDLDIKPWSDPNAINTNSKGVVPVAILGSDTFDVNDVDTTTVVFGPAAATPAHEGGHFEDVNSDGDMDLLFHFYTQETGLAVGDTEACLDGATLGGTPIAGCDSVNVIK